jgi:hypothetical protein
MKQSPRPDVVDINGNPHRKLLVPTTKAHNSAAKVAAIAAAKVRAKILRSKP